MAVRHEPEPKFPLLSAFELAGEVEDGLTSSHRPVYVVAPGQRMPVPLVDLEPVTEPQALAAWATPQEAMHPAVRRAERCFSFVGRFVDPRTANEEMGDALERMSRLAEAGAPVWMLYGMAGVAVFWTLVHAVRERLGK